MEKSKKILLRVLPMLFVFGIVILTNGVFADVINIDDPIPGGNIGNLNTVVGRVWGTVSLILQVAAIAAIVFAGVRYMFSSADAKADIKKSMGILAVGAVLVFGATTIVNFILSITNQALGQ